MNDDSGNPRPYKIGEMYTNSVVDTAMLLHMATRGSYQPIGGDLNDALKWLRWRVVEAWKEPYITPNADFAIRNMCLAVIEECEKAWWKK